MEGVAREMARSLGSARREAAAHRLALRKKRKAATSKTSAASSNAPAPTRSSGRLESSPPLVSMWLALSLREGLREERIGSRCG